MSCVYEGCLLGFQKVFMGYLKSCLCGVSGVQKCKTFLNSLGFPCFQLGQKSFRKNMRKYVGKNEMFPPENSLLSIL